MSAERDLRDVIDTILGWVENGPHYLPDANPQARQWMAVAAEGIARDVADLPGISHETRTALIRAADESLTLRAASTGKDDDDPCDGTGIVECWSPGGPCPPEQIATGCELCGPCQTCHPTREEPGAWCS